MQGLPLDADSIAAGIVAEAVQRGRLALPAVEARLGPTVARLLADILEVRHARKAAFALEFLIKTLALSCWSLLVGSSVSCPKRTSEGRFWVIFGRVFAKSALPAQNHIPTVKLRCEHSLMPAHEDRNLPLQQQPTIWQGAAHGRLSACMNVLILSTSMQGDDHHAGVRR